MKFFNGLNQKTWLLATIALSLFAGLSHAQYEDFLDAPTQTMEDTVGCTIEGVQFEKKVGKTPDEKELTILFLLTEHPSAYFNYYDVAKKAIVFDFYDTKIGSSIMEPIKEHPITNSSIEQMRVDLNKDVGGLRPDWRDVVRVTLHTPYDIEFDINEDYGIISFKFKWSRKIEKQFKREKTSFYWKFPLALGALGGAGFAGYFFFLREEPPPSNAIVDGLPPRPDASSQ